MNRAPELEVNETIYSLSGIRPILNDVLEKVVEPLRILTSTIPPRTELGKYDPLPPKFILLSGSEGSGKKAVTSAIVNEMRRGPGNKTADLYYSHRQVNYIGWDRTTWDPDLESCLQDIFDESNMRDHLTVILFRDFHSFFPSSLTQDDPRARARRRRHDEASLILKFSNLLDTIRRGKVLVIGSTSRPDKVDTGILSKVEYSFHLPIPDREAREEMLRSFLEAEEAVLSSRTWSTSQFMNSLLDSTSVDFSAGDLQHIVRSSATHARMITTESGSKNISPVPIEPQHVDRYVALNGLERERGAAPTPRRQVPQQQRPLQQRGQRNVILIPANGNIANNDADAEVENNILQEFQRIRQAIEDPNLANRLDEDFGLGEEMGEDGEIDGILSDSD